MRVLDRIQRDLIAVGRVDTETRFAHLVHQLEPGRHGPVHVVFARSKLHVQQPSARRVPGEPDDHVREPGPRGVATRRHRHDRGPSDSVGVQPLHRYSAAAPLSGHRHARDRHGVRVLFVDPAADDSVRLFQRDTLPSVPIARMPTIRVPLPHI